LDQGVVAVASGPRGLLLHFSVAQPNRGFGYHTSNSLTSIAPQSFRRHAGREKVP
jgi:hypothetical protein